MPEWLNFEDPLVRKLVYAAVGVLVLIVLVRIWQGWRAAAASARRRAELRHTRDQVQMKQQEIQRLAERIIATSSTATIAGFVIVRQIEAVFAEGQRSPTEAVELLKALAARKGANALTNLSGQRLPSGKCVANGDAVIVRPADAPPPATPPAESTPPKPR